MKVTKVLTNETGQCPVDVAENNARCEDGPVPFAHAAILMTAAAQLLTYFMLVIIVSMTTIIWRKSNV